MHVHRRQLLGAFGTTTFALAGCLEEDSEPIEATATSPASLPEPDAADDGFDAVVEEETTVETTIHADIEGDVEMSASRDVIATVFRRGYADGEGRQFGLVTAPIVELIEGQDLMRDPIDSVDDSQVIGLATGADVASVDDWTAGDDVEFLGEEAALSKTTVEADGSVEAWRAHAEVDADGVTGIALAPADGPEPAALFEDAVRDD